MEWIKIQDKQPQFGERVLTAYGENDGFKKSILIQIRQLKKIEQDEKGTKYLWIDDDSGKQVDNTTHWMPLPGTSWNDF